MPGRWERVFISAPVTGVKIQFYDTRFGILLLDTGEFVRPTSCFQTTDTGKTWNYRGRETTIYSMGTTVPHGFDIPTLTDYYYMDQGNYWVSHDAGKTWAVSSLPGGQHPLKASRMFTPAYGIGLSIPNDIYTFMTTDSTNSFGYRASTTAPPLASITDAVWLDSNRCYVALRVGVHDQIWKSEDGARTWKTSYASSFATVISQIVASQDSLFAYALLLNYSNGPASMLKTTNGGQLWVTDSAIYKPRIQHMASPARGKLWACVANSPHGPADSLYYSSDNGKSWSVDSTTFIGDTILSMAWPDSSHGFILAQRHDTLWAYRYIPEGVGSVSDRVMLVASQLSIRPNPADDRITVESANGQLIIMDALGRTYDTPKVANVLDVSKLASGVYFITDGRNRTKFVKE